MSRGAPASPLMNPTQGTTQAVMQGAQVANQQQAIRNQAAAQRQEAQLKQQQMELARQQGFQQSAVQMADIAERARSQEEYRNLLAKKSETEAEIARNAQAERTRQFNEGMEFEKFQYDEMLRMEDEALELKARLADAKGEASIRLMQDLQNLREKSSALALKMTQAKHSLKTGVDDTMPLLENMEKQIAEKIADTRIVTDQINSGLAEELSVNQFTGNLDETFGIQTGGFERGARDVLGALNVMRYLGDVPSARQALILRALGEDEGAYSLIARGGEAIASLGLTEVLGEDVQPINIRETMDRKISGAIADTMVGIKEDQRGQLKEGLFEIFKKASADPTSMKQMKGEVTRLASQLKIDPLILHTALDTAGSQLKARKEALLGLGIPDNYVDLDDLDKGMVSERLTDAGLTDIDAFDAFVLKKFFGGEHTNHIIGLGLAMDPVDNLENFKEQVTAELNRAGGFSAKGFQQIVSDFEDDYYDLGSLGIDESGLGGLGGLRQQELGIEELQRLINLDEQARADLTNRANIRGEATSARAEADVYRDLLEARRDRRQRRGDF